MLEYTNSHVIYVHPKPQKQNSGLLTKSFVSFVVLGSGLLCKSVFLISVKSYHATMPGHILFAFSFYFLFMFTKNSVFYWLEGGLSAVSK